MPQFDLPLARLREYRSSLVEPPDFTQFWQDSLADADQHPVSPTYTPYECGLRTVDVFDATFRGWGGGTVSAWLIVPRDRTQPGPAVVEYIGYSGGRGLPIAHLDWSAAGYVHLVVDTRGQGSSAAATGTTADDAGPTGPHAPGFLTMGIESPDHYFYRRVFVDAARAVAAVREHPLVDPDRVAVTGGSQGGGIALAAGGLVDGLVAVMPDVPFLCDMRRASELTDARPYLELVQYCAAHRDLVEEAFGTLAYFDGTCFAAHSDAPALFSVALRDEVCPPSTVFAAYNAYRGQRSIEIYSYNGHEGGSSFQRAAQVNFLAGLLR